MAKLHTHATIFSAELYAIFAAITIIYNQPHQFVIFTDSLSSLKAIENFSNSKHHLVFNIIKLLKQLPCNKIILEWVPSHMGIEGNESADKIAKESLSLPNPTMKNIAQPDFNKLLKKHTYKMWQQNWEHSNSSHRVIKPNLTNSIPKSLSRKEQVCYSRLRLNTTVLTHKHYFEKQAPPHCNTCNMPITIPHLLLHCTKYDPQRLKLKLACTQADIKFEVAPILSNDIILDDIMAFLKTTELLEKI